MKKYTLLFVVVVLMSLPSSVLAVTPIKESTKSAVPKNIGQVVKDKVQEKVTEIKETVKQATLRKLGNSINARLAVYEKLIKRTTVLLDKLDTKILAARAKGANTTDMDKLMVDSRLKLSSASATLVTVKTASSSASTKADFTVIKTDFQIIRSSLNVIRLNSAKVISLLKIYNVSTKSAELKESTSGSKIKPSITKVPPPRYNNSSTSALQK